MPGIPTLFKTLDLTIAELDAEGLSQFSAVMKSNPGYAYLGVIGASIGDFMPSDPSSSGNNYQNIWKVIFSLVGTDQGYLALLSQMTKLMNELQPVLDNEDTGALKALADAGFADQLNTLSTELYNLIQGTFDAAKGIATVIGQNLKPDVDTASPGDPVPPPTQWEARDFLHWKKSGQFLRNLLDAAAASKDARMQAYAYGYLVSYTCKVCGGPFLNSVVGGPPRTQWWRQRFVSNYVDAWVYGFYEYAKKNGSRPTMTDDNPSPPYDQWPSLCGANLQRNLNLGTTDAVDPAALLDNIQAPFPKVIPSDFASFWMTVAQQTFGSLPPGITAAAFNDAYVMTWLMLWFQTSGAVFGCNVAQPVAPPDGCGIDQSELDPFQQAPGGGPNLPPKTHPDQDVSTDTGAEICGVVMAIIGGLTFLFGGGVGGAAAIGEGINLVLSSKHVNWADLRCHLYWYRMFLYNGIVGIEKLLALTAFGYPDSGTLANADPQVLSIYGIKQTLDSAPAMVKSPGPAPCPSQPWDGSPLTFEKPPAVFEQPAAMPYLAQNVYPSWVIDDPTNPLSNGDVKTGGTFPFRRMVPAAPYPVEFGNVVANAIDLFKNVRVKFPNWNLDGDRGLAYFTWQFHQASYDPNAVAIDPEP